MYLRCSRNNHIFTTRIELTGKRQNDPEQALPKKAAIRIFDIYQWPVCQNEHLPDSC